MAPTERLVPRFAAEPPQERLPYGRWGDRLRDELLSAFLELEAGTTDPEDADEMPEGGLGEPGEIAWYPDRTWGGRTYVPATCRSTTGVDLYGVVSFAPATGEDEEPDHFASVADWTAETAEANPDWSLDLCDEVVGGWRGERGEVAAMTLVWGRATKRSIALVTATAELGELTVDKCLAIEDRFSLLAPDDYLDDTLVIVGWDGGGGEVARESLYADDDGEDETATGIAADGSPE